MIRARLRDHLPTIDRQYRRHVSGQGRAYRLRGGESQQAPGPEPRNGGRRNEGCAPTRAGRQSGMALVSIAAIIEPKVGGESAVSTTGGLDSSFAASTASTRRSGDREGGGQEEEGASNHTEEGGSYTEGEGTIEGMGSSIRGSGGESFLSEQVGLWGMLFQLLHRRRHPSRCSRSRLRRPQGAVRFSAQHWRSAGASGKSYQGGEREETAWGGGGEGRERSGGGQPHEQRRRVLCMTRGCTDGSGPWPSMEP